MDTAKVILLSYDSYHYHNNMLGTALHQTAACLGPCTNSQLCGPVRDLTAPPTACSTWRHATLPKQTLLSTVPDYLYEHTLDITLIKSLNIYNTIIIIQVMLLQCCMHTLMTVVLYYGKASKE